MKNVDNSFYDTVQFEGTELLDDFIVTCKGWLDEGGHLDINATRDLLEPNPVYFRILLTDWGSKTIDDKVVLYEGCKIFYTDL